ncbi:GTPase-associated system all-helical protein GASH [Methylobacterium sp. OT2]|uniref:GTPase-associated system all-helical protein GASH n=1 Tax=Methylobacterium sp. OT2 TaxID=2813779 RepID=UPI00197C747F|nr:GTPase-associated system all-helical protein GASH [Methylobacterium sp. OT2]MBN4097049.1 hypothetical protein [Methylobacterium sp. OT2]
MSENNSTFDFAATYLKLQPGADRKIITAREFAHRKAQKELVKDTNKIVDLAFLAFDIPVTGNRAPTWLEAIVNEKDPHFSLERGRNEARIIATMLLAERIHDGYQATPALVMTGSLGGRRQTVDHEAIVMAARSLLARLGRARGLRFDARLARPAWRDVTKTVAAAKGGDSLSINAAIEAVAKEAKDAEMRLVDTFNNVLGQLTNENRRLAEEVDLLWWRMSRWSYLLDRPLSEIDERALPFVAGTDVATMITVLPGPHGALGVIRDILGPAADEVQTLRSTFEAIPAADRASLLKDVTPDVQPIASLNAGLQLYVDDSIAASLPAIFARRTGVSIDTELTRFQIAVQSFYERALIKSGWI